MALEDRERDFEKALRRELRANGASGLECPDAETLAAYHERMLSPEEMAAQKSHIAACPRCQEILATLEVTEAIPSGWEDAERVLEKSAAAVPVAPVLAKSIEAAGVKTASVREMPKRKIYLRWAVPAGAIAAGLLAWIAINVSRPTAKLSPSAPVQIAENREQKEQPLSVPKPETKAPTPNSQMSDRIAENERAYSKQELDTTVSSDQAKTGTRGRPGATATYDHGPRVAQNQMQNQAQNQIQNNRQIAGQNQAAEQFQYNTDGLAQTGKNESPIPQNAPRRSEMMKAVPAAPPPPPAESAPAAAGKATDADARKDAGVRASTETVEVTAAAPSVATDDKADKNVTAALKKLKEVQAAGGLTTASLRDTGEGGLALIPTPDPKVFWIGGINGVVLKTEDGGKTSKKQKISDGIKVLAGSAIDARTCWLIADRGIVLRTVDGGKHWTTMTAPDVANFTTIKAASATQATIRDASGSVRYSTTDGGVTWSVAQRP